MGLHFFLHRTSAIISPDDANRNSNFTITLLYARSGSEHHEDAIVETHFYSKTLVYRGVT